MAQWNHSIEYSLGEWVILATDDDIYDKSFLTTADSLLSKYPQVDIFRARVYDFERNINEVWRCEPAMPEYVSIEEYTYSRERFLLGGIPQFVFRRSALDAIGGFVNFPLAWYSDDATSIRLAENGMACSSENLVYIRCSGINLSSAGKYEEEKLLSRFLFNEYLFKTILPLFRPENQGKYQRFYDKQVRFLFPLRIKERLLMNAYRFSVRKRIGLLKVIDEHTPYLSRKNKLIMKARLFVKWQ